MEGTDWIGNRELLASLEHKSDDSSEGAVIAIMIEGMRGVGKSKLLRKLADRCRRQKMLTLYVRLHEGDDERAVVRKIVEQLRTALLEMDGNTAKTENPGKLGPGIAHLIEKAEMNLPQGVGAIAILLDDMDELRDANILLSKFSDALEKRKPLQRSGVRTNALTPKRPRGWLVAASGMYFQKNYGFERYMIAPLDGVDVEHILVHALEKSGVRWGDECLQTLIRESGNNPQMFLTMARLLYDHLGPEEKRLTKAHYMENAQLIRQETAGVFDALYYRTSKQERRILVHLAKKDPQRVTELARALRLPLNTVTALVIRLLQKGSVVKPERGIYRLFNPLYGRYILSR